MIISLQKINPHRDAVNDYTNKHSPIIQSLRIGRLTKAHRITVRAWIDVNSYFDVPFLWNISVVMLSLGIKSHFRP